VRTVDNQVYSSKLNMAQQMLYNPILGIVKASIILFLLRLGDRRWFIRYGLIAFFIFKSVQDMLQSQTHMLIFSTASDIPSAYFSQR
jgi:hypothetical protein